jgi:4'-phosphopantetheinyl transferase
MRVVGSVPLPLGRDAAIPPLAAGDVHVWTVRLDAAAALLPVPADVLNADELARAARYVFETDRLAFLRGRAALRLILATYLGISPATVPLRKGRQDKPELGPPFDASALHFNVSNTGNLALYAVARDGPIGIDVEQVRPVADLEGVAGLILSEAEQAAFSATDAQDRLAFFHAAWTRKEAYLKALGYGLMRSPTLVELGALLGEAGEPIRDAGDATAAERWQLTTWQPAEGYCAALVATLAVEHIVHLGDWE